MNKPRIIHWIPSANLGGCEILLATFIEGCESKYDNIIVTGSEGPAVELWKGIGGSSVKRIDSWWNKNPINWMKEFKRILSTYSDFYFIAWSPSRLPFIRWAIRKTSVKSSVIHIGSRVSTNTFNNFRDRVFDFLLHNNKTEKLKLIGCSNYVAESIRLDSYYSQFSSVGILNGIRSLFFLNIKEMPFNEKFRFCTVGRLDKAKNHIGMVQNIVALRKINKNIIFDIIGEGDMRPFITKEIEENKAFDYISLLGNKSNVKDILGDYNFFIFNSLPLEGMGIALAEAMSRGLVCIVNNTSLMHEMLGDCGIYYDSTDQFVSLVNSLDRATILELSKNTRKRAETLFKSSMFTNAYIRELKQMA